MGPEATDPPLCRQSATTTCSRRSPRAAWGPSTGAGTAKPVRSSPSRSCRPTWPPTPSCSSASSRSSAPPAGSTTPTSSAPSTTATTATCPTWSWSSSRASRSGQKLERDGRMPETDAIRIIAQVAQGLHRAHKQNLIHRDVKPDNILVSTDGMAKLADLGLVKETETDLNLTQDRPRSGHAALHGPGAVPQRQERRRPLRHLQPGRHALPDGDRRVALQVERARSTPG